MKIFPCPFCVYGQSAGDLPMARQERWYRSWPQAKPVSLNKPMESIKPFGWCGAKPPRERQVSRPFSPRKARPWLRQYGNRIIEPLLDGSQGTRGHDGPQPSSAAVPAVSSGQISWCRVPAGGNALCIRLPLLLDPQPLRWVADRFGGTTGASILPYGKVLTYLSLQRQT